MYKKKITSTVIFFPEKKIQRKIKTYLLYSH